MPNYCGSIIASNFASISLLASVTHWLCTIDVGHGSAARNLGLLYTMGIAPDENGRAAVNLPEAFYWYNEAAKMGNHKVCIDETVLLSPFVDACRT